MNIFEYLPQLIVAYDGNDEFANLIHVKKANKDIDYYCPCCGGIVKPRALDSNKEQSHYYHITGKCTKESQLHFFCKNWLFEQGSKFYIKDELFEVKSLEIEKKWNTKFGDYIPDITVYTTSGKIIYFEMFFSNRKTGDDYFCKWNDLNNDVVEINIKEYISKSDLNVIPTFSYLYHDGQCFSKTYVKRDIYANTIGKIKNELTRQKVLNYKSRIEQLDWFWQKIIQNQSKEEIIKSVREMTYEDMVSCYEIIKRKQCVSYLKKDILDAINQKVVKDIRGSLDIPFNENVYFDLLHISGRTYEIGIRLKMQTEHIKYNKFYLHCERRYWEPLKVVFKKNIFTLGEVIISKKWISELKKIYEETIMFKKQLLEYEKELAIFEDKGYRVRFDNNYYTVLIKTLDNKFEPVLEDYYMSDLDTELLLRKVQESIKEKYAKLFVKNYIHSQAAQNIISNLQDYKGIDKKISIKYKEKNYNCHEAGIYFDLYLYGSNVYSRIISANEKDFLEAVKFFKNKIDEFSDKYETIIKIVEKINNCKNKFWKAELLFDRYNNLNIKIDQKYINLSIQHMTYKLIDLSEIDLSDETCIYNILISGMKSIMKNMEEYGYRVMEVRSNNE